MAFADPQSVTINSVAQSMPRIQTDGQKAIYQKADQTWKLTISHVPSKDGRVRSMARLDQKKVVTDPLTSVNDYDTLSYYFVIDRPSFGFSMTECEQIVAGFNAWLTAGNVDKLFGQEA